MLEIAPVEAAKTAGWERQTEEVIQLKIKQPSSARERRNPLEPFVLPGKLQGKLIKQARDTSLAVGSNHENALQRIDTQRQCNAPHRITHANQRLRRFLC